ncbi:hypothetical protein EVG20_g7436 [Dentipellis fragilis]|uniref:Uncharacterized protein n=1 Tax=Dentipellis fragilis TaxID=205917 RepID=A0A4Y9YFQ7_9AGAM|nr:hypothetical protein EVG20_g7436 [Dentipellis fragilis]
MRAVMTRIVSGYIFDSSDLKQFIHKLLGDDDPWLAENGGTTSHYTVLVQWLQSLPRAERVASVQCIALPSRTAFYSLLTFAITGIAEHHSSKARISETEKQQKMRDRFVEKVNAAAGTPVLMPERMKYFSLEATCLAGPVGECCFDYKKWVATERQAVNKGDAAAEAEA